MVQKLRLGKILFFNAHHEIDHPYTGGNASFTGQFNLKTPYKKLDKDLCIVSVVPSHIVDPHGKSARFGAKLIGLEVVGDSNEEKTLRVRYKVWLHGHNDVEMVALNINGIIVSGIKEDEENKYIHKLVLETNAKPKE